MNTIHLISDSEFQERTVEEVNADTGGAFVKMSDGWSIRVDVPGGMPFPQVGEIIRTYGRGIGYAVRGIAVGGRLYRYATREQWEEQQKLERVVRDAGRRAEFEAKREDFDRRFEALPAEFKARIMGFRERGGPDWRWQFEAYELFVCEQAKVIANAVPADQLTAFRDLPWRQQKELVPGIDDGHSGNSFGCALGLARMYLEDPKIIARWHGSMCPLVGCKDFGCYAARDKSDGVGA